MKSRLKLLVAIGFAGFLLVMPSIAGADDRDDDDDHDLARELFEHGEIRALSEILQTLSERTHGDVVAVDLITLDGKWIYRFQVVETDGRRVVVDVDAGAGVVREGSED